MATYDTPIPGVADYGQVELAAKTAYQNALSNLNQQRMDTLQQYGYAADVDPNNGTLTNMRVDSGNQYGQYQQLLRNSAGETQQLRDDVVGRGLGGGIAQQAADQSKYDYGAGAFTLGTNLQNALHGYQSQQTAAADTRDQATAQAQLSAARDAIANQQFNQALQQQADEFNQSQQMQADSLAAQRALAASSAMQPSVQNVQGGQVMNFTPQQIAQINASPNALRTVGSDAAQSATRRILPLGTNALRTMAAPR